MPLHHPAPVAAGWRAALAACGVVWALGAAAPAAAQPPALAPVAAEAPAGGFPRVLGELHEALLDDPELTLVGVQRRREALAQRPGDEEAFWLALAAARLQLLLEHDDPAAASLEAARRWAESPAALSAEQARWLEFITLRHRAITEGSPAALQALLAARTRLGVEPGSVLACEWDETEGWLLREMGSYDEAWRVAESLQRCTASTGWPHYRAQALAEQAALTGLAGSLGVGGQSPGPRVAERVAGLFEEAYAALGGSPSRFLRSLMAYSAGTTLTGMNRPAEAARQLDRALAASRALADRAGIAAALTAMASLKVREDRHAEALKLLDEAEPVLRSLDAGNAARLVALYTARLRSLAALGRRDELPSAMARASALPEAGVQPAPRERLARALAAAHAALGQHAAAYDAMLRAQALAEQSRGQASGAQVTRLQLLYDNSRREAELAALRHAEEKARLSLQAQQATARTLWLALVAAAVLFSAAAALGWRQWRRRRELAELALRDTLTGLANRRAIEAYARAQFEQARRLKLPLTLAMIDLDHFKEVNDRHGHATGDALLKAFAAAVPALLRAPDRLGRWGGEEFLLVLPGTTLNELPGVFLRLRSAFAGVAVAGLAQPHGRSFSMGGAEAGDTTPSFEALVEAADRRLYEAKAGGRDRLG
jgi:diguanylate cyclase (GGDEF)-like protein